jgi:RNA polymerase sigma-70 factor (ECF subfamily)
LDVDRERRMEAAITLTLSGDRQAFAQIVREHQAMVFSIAWHFLPDKSLADDLAQEVFLDLYRALPAIRSAAHLTNWLRRAAVHRCLDQGRRRKAHREIGLESAPEPAGTYRPVDSFLAQRLQSALADLPEKQRIVVLLRYQEDLDPAEIAGLLDMPVNTVKSSLHRALDQLRGKLERKLKEARYAFL